MGPKFCLVAVGLVGACSAVPQAAPQSETPPTRIVVAQFTQKEAQMSKPVSIVGNTARDGQIAIKEEFDAAMASRSTAALELFIRRHPQSEWTPAAKAELARLQKSSN